MKSTFDVSFIIPNFNSGNALRNTIESIINKELKFTYEILIMDGNSSDDSLLFLKPYYLKYMTCITERDENVYDAMNKGIKLAKGRWLLFLGAGDLLSKSFNDINLHSYNDYVMLYGSVFWKSKNIIYDQYFSLEKIFYKNVCQQAVLYNRQIFEINGLFDIKYYISADYKFNLKIFIFNFRKIKYLDLIISEYKGNGLSHFVKDEFAKNKNKYILIFLLKKFSIFSMYTLSQRIFILISKKLLKV